MSRLYYSNITEYKFLNYAITLKMLEAERGLVCGNANDE